jgi:lipoprotein
MKYLVSILAIAMLASCGAKNTDTTKTTTNTSTNNEINQKIKSMS